jgi:hypothetical protein
MTETFRRLNLMTFLASAVFRCSVYLLQPYKVNGWSNCVK